MQEEQEEMTKVGVECNGSHEDLIGEMEKTGSDSKTCPHCGMVIKKPEEAK